MPKISVIIPIYNAELYLRQCLDSVIKQTFEDIEIICVDDGSTDSSLEILKEYASFDDRFLIIHQENQYAGVARNNGMKNASGEYYVFWDADDFFEPQALELLFNRITEMNADICVCGANRYYSDIDLKVPYKGYLNMKRVPENEPFNIITNPDYIITFTCTPVWNKIFRASFIKKKNLIFKPVRNGNDIFFCTNALCMASSIVTIDKKLVNYRRFSESSLTSTVKKAPQSLFQSWIETGKNLKEEGCFPESSYLDRVLDAVFFVLHCIDDYYSFVETVEYLQREGLAAFGVTVDIGERIHLSKRFLIWIQKLYELSPQEFLCFFAFSTYKFLAEESQNNNNKAIKFQRKAKNTQKLLDSSIVSNEKLNKRLNEELENKIIEKKKLDHEISTLREEIKSLNMDLLIQKQELFKMRRKFSL